MSLYERYFLPHLINMSCGTDLIGKQREKVVPLVEGRVLEVGMGSGLNLPFYDPQKVEFVWGLEPSEGMRKKAQRNLDHTAIEVKWIDSPGEEIPLEDHSVDTVLLTFTLCTIPDWLTALQQMYRVLKPDGRLVFCEHGASPDPAIRIWQDRIDPYWGKVSGGCHLNRPIPQYLEKSGFILEKLESAYLPNTPKIAGFNYWGTATKT